MIKELFDFYDDHKHYEKHVLFENINFLYATTHSVSKRGH